MAEAELARFIDRYTIEYVRTYPHPIERVWRAVSDPAEVATWFWGPGRSEQRLGGGYHFGAEVDGFEGTIAAFEPPRLIRYGGTAPGASSYWGFELQAVRGGTRVVFVQHIEPGEHPAKDWPRDPPGTPADTPWWPGTLSGWHRGLDHLGALMDRRPWRRPDTAARESLDQRYRDHMLATLP
ncbi:MAG: SRPBCC domain-containing protein [Caulobacteraceae bacterium]